MAVLDCTKTDQFPPVIAEAVKLAVEATLASILGETPGLVGETGPSGACDAIVATLAYVGDVNWQLTLVLPRETAPALAKQSAGFDIDYEGPDMGDVVGELLNVLGGDVTAKLDHKRIKAQMSLPNVARGHDIEVLLADGAPAVQLAYRAAQGPFWLRLAAAKPSHHPCRRPGT
jgi:CheY-specific phosphatase CheX